MRYSICKLKSLINSKTSFFGLFIIKLGIYFKINYLSLLGFTLYLISNSGQNYLLYLIRVFKNKNKPYLILLQKTGFNKDTVIIKNTFGNIDCLGFSRDFVKGIANCFLSKDICDNNYYSCSTIHNKSKRNLFKFYNFLFSNLPLRLKPLAILTGNFGYSPEQELFKAAYKNQIKGIAIHKECLKTDGLYDLWKYIYSVRRDVFYGTLSLVYNNIELNLQKETKVIDTTMTKIRVIGCPRLDKAHFLRKNINKIEKHQVLLFGFGSKTALPLIPRKSYENQEPHYEYLNREDKNLSWVELLNDTCSAYYACAKKNPNVEFLIKLKAAYRENYETINFFKSREKLKNLTIITVGDSISLLEKTSILISFTSTAIFEGIARGIPIIMPSFGECKKEKYKPYFFNFSNLDQDIMTANSKDQLESQIYNLLKLKPKVNSKLSENKKNLLNKWVGNPDGKSGERLIQNLSKELL